MAAFRLGVVDYLNAAPLWYPLKRDSRVELVPDVPSQLASMLRDGAIDAGLIPIIEYFRSDDLRLVSGMGVCSHGPVRSVRLFRRCPVEMIGSVRLDGNSRTSAALTQVILQDLYGIRATYRSGVVDPGRINDMSEDAALIIGDPALRAAHNTTLPSLDLGQEWHKLTGRPFVYAGWLIGSGIPEAREGELAAILRAAAQTGCAELRRVGIEFLATHTSCGFGESMVLHYLSKVISYTVGDAELAGLDEFAQRASFLGLCSERPILLAQ